MKKADKNIIGMAMQDALNASFNFGMAHQRAIDAGSVAMALKEEAMAAGQNLASLIIPRAKKDLN